MEKGPGCVHREIKGAELKALRVRLSELAMDLPGTLAQFEHENPEAAREYREAEQSVIDARERVHSREGLNIIY